MSLRFGRKPPKFNSKTLLLKDYLPKTSLPTPVRAVGWEYQVSDARWSRSMLGNEEAGDCAWAAPLHAIMCSQANVGVNVDFTTQQALSLYSKYTGYDPAQTDANGNNPTDQGSAMTDVLDAWQRDGFYGHKILGWAAVNPSDLVQVRAALYAFGGLLAGFRVTAGMMQQFQDGEAWNAPFDGSEVGSHAVPILGYGHLGQTCISWARRQQCDLDWWQLCDELFAVVTPDWLDAQGKSPSGLDLATLTADLASLSS